MTDRPTDSAIRSMIQGMSATPERAAARAPRIPVALAVVVVLLAAAVGAWLVYRYAVRGTSASVAEVVELDEAALRMTRGMGGVNRQRGAIVVRGPDYQLRATRSGENGYAIAFDFLPDIRQSWVTPEQWELHQLAQRAASIPKFARHIKLNDDQRRQLRALPDKVSLTPADVQKLRPFLSDWDRAKDEAVRQSAASPLLEAAESVAANRRADTKAAQLRRVQEIPKIITPEQQKLAETYILPTGAAPAAAAPSP